MVGPMEAFKDESRLQGDQNCFTLYCISKYPCLNFQPCHYEEGCFCILWYVKTQRNQMPKKLYIFYFI
jgi:hypothetical protein